MVCVGHCVFFISAPPLIACINPSSSAAQSVLKSVCKLFIRLHGFYCSRSFSFNATIYIPREVHFADETKYSIYPQGPERRNPRSSDDCVCLSGLHIAP